MALKMYCVFSKEAIAKMKGNRGKLAAQAGHAYLHAYWDAERRFESYYGGLGGDFEANPEKYRNSQRAYKICLVAENDDVLKELYELYKAACGVSLVTDAGITVFEEPTITCLGIGPIQDEDREEILRSLKVFI